MQQLTNLSHIVLMISANYSVKEFKLAMIFMFNATVAKFSASIVAKSLIIQLLVRIFVSGLSWLMIKVVPINGLLKILKFALLVNSLYKNILGVRRLNVCVGLNFVISVMQSGMKIIRVLKDNVFPWPENQVLNREHQQLLSFNFTKNL